VRNCHSSNYFLCIVEVLFHTLLRLFFSSYDFPKFTYDATCCGFIWIYPVSNLLNCLDTQFNFFCHYLKISVINFFSIFNSTFFSIKYGSLKTQILFSIIPLVFELFVAYFICCSNWLFIHSFLCYFNFLRQSKWDLKNVSYFQLCNFHLTFDFPWVALTLPHQGRVVFFIAGCE
jgi:hypothetical protein